MARQARVISKTDYYHVIMRGNNKDYIFKRNTDKAYFMEYLLKLQDEGLISVAGWCLMDNHVHLIVRAEPDHLTTVFKRLNIKYAMMYHREYKTVGHVFQDRFMSEPIETDEYMMLVTRYIHQNPVKAKMVKSPEEYKWSSYKSYIKDDLNETMKFVKSLFNNNDRGFKEYHQEEDDEEYLEIKEDQIRYREERCQKIIADFCNKYDIIESREIYNNKELLKEIIDELADRSGMSLRAIAKHIEVSFSTIQAIRKKK